MYLYVDFTGLSLLQSAHLPNACTYVKFLSSFIAFALISKIALNLLPFKGLLSLGNKKKSQWGRSDE